jgi:hypothetical protein
VRGQLAALAAQEPHTAGVLHRAVLGGGHDGL